MATSTLNPKTPIFVSSAYHAVEDFSDQCFDFDADVDDFDFSGFDFDADMDDFDFSASATPILSLTEPLSTPKPRVAHKIQQYGQKVPKIVNVKVRPRPIQQSL
ncbi:uncharacterized protein LOC116033297 [Ipomoea triloba]|uniref:uncharacterized protein LOC116033297 n=1 Tax=Ipomoea triloba TaxID=35885 RepID=UPI00125DB3C9|nr:uncharacterized protein LOC116033297 [Ipomoea triloba]